MIVGKLNTIQKTYPDHIFDVRGRGLMLALELNSKIDIDQITNNLLDKAIIIGYKQNTLRFMPPLIIERQQIDELITVLKSILKQI